MENHLTYLQCSPSTSTFAIIRHTNKCPWIMCIPVKVNNFVSAYKEKKIVFKMKLQGWARRNRKYFDRRI